MRGGPFLVKAGMNFHITIISVFPELHTVFCNTSLSGRAQEAGIVEYSFIRLADCASPKQRIDTPACGPGDGMVLRAPIIEKAVQKAEQEHGAGIKIFFSPQGVVLTQKRLRTFVQSIFTFEQNEAVGHSKSKECDSTCACLLRPGQQIASRPFTRRTHIILVCGRYEGIDVRVEKAYADYLFSIGDYVLMGGDIPAQVFLEAMLRLIPGVVGKASSVDNDSFSGSFLDWPVYGLPAEWHGHKIPEILRSGNHAAIDAWRKDKACCTTLQNRFDWMRRTDVNFAEQEYIAKCIPAHYAVLMHDQVLVGKTKKEPGVTSVTTIDLHDVARSCATYGIKKFFVVTPLKDQQALLDVFFQFWHTSKGKQYNKNRFEAMSLVEVCSSLAEVQECVAALHSAAVPLKIATSAQFHTETETLSYEQQGRVWCHARPVLLLFGTGQGLVSEIVAQCDYVLQPVYGMTTYNHLSVRSAVAVVLDRWLGWWGKKRES